jgi:hypothetical protein
MPTDLTPFPKPGVSLGSDHSFEPASVVHSARRPRNWMRLVRRLVWLVPLWLLGTYASRTIRNYYGGSVLPSTTHWVVIIGLVAAAGAVGALMFVATRWSSVFLMALVGGAVWAMAFVGAIPATNAVCGGDVAAGCEHTQALQWPIVTAAAYLPILVGLLVPTCLWCRFVRQRTSARAT